MIDRKQPPQFSNQFSITLPEPEIINLSNGIGVYWINKVDQPVVKIEVIYKAGKYFESANGVSFFTASLLDKGTTSKSSKEIAEGFEQLGAQIELSSGLDYLTASLYSLNRTLDKAWGLFREVLSEPVFPEQELELNKQIQLQNLKVNNEKNSFVASKLIRKNVFGQPHPYGRYLEESDILSLDTSSLRRYFKRFIPHQIYITGKIHSKQFKSIIEWLDQLNASEDSQPRFQVLSGQKKEIVKKSNSIQSAIRFGKRSIKNTDRDYPIALVYNHILGGYFGSRLMKNIREEKGLTYGIYSSLNNFLSDSFFSIGADVNNENIELTISEITKELHELQKSPLNNDELTIVKNHLLGNFQLELANPFSVAEKIKSIYLNNLPNNFYQSITNAILKASPINIQEVAHKHFTSSEVSIVIVG